MRNYWQQFHVNITIVCWHWSHDRILCDDRILSPNLFKISSTNRSKQIHWISGMKNVRIIPTDHFDLFQLLSRWCQLRNSTRGDRKKWSNIHWNLRKTEEKIKQSSSSTFQPSTWEKTLQSNSYSPYELPDEYQSSTITWMSLRSFENAFHKRH